MRNGNVGTVEELSKYISRRYLLLEEARVKLARGQQKTIASSLHDLFTVEELASLKDRKLLTLTATNKKQYKMAESATLKVLVKNVKEISVKIFKVDMEKQYLENDQELNE